MMTKKITSFKTLLVFLFFMSFVLNGIAKSSEIDSAGVWYEINNGFASCPAIGETGGQASMFNERFEVLKTMNRKGLIYTLVRYGSGCMPTLYEHDTTINKWRCVARLTRDMGMIYGANTFIGTIMADGKDIIIINPDGTVYKFTKDYANFPSGWEAVSNSGITPSWVRMGLNGCNDTCMDITGSYFPSKFHTSSFVGGKAYFVTRFHPDYDERFRIVQFDLLTGEWTKKDLPAIPRYNTRCVYGGCGNIRGIDVVFTEPIAGLFSFHVSYIGNSDFKDSVDVVHTFDPRTNQWIDISKGIIPLSGGTGTRLISSWDNQKLIALNNNGIYEWTGNGWKVIVPASKTKSYNIGIDPIVTANGVLFYDGDGDARKTEEFFYSEPDIISMRNAVQPDPYSIFKDLNMDKAYTKYATPDNGKTWYASIDMNIGDYNDFISSIANIKDEYVPYVKASNSNGGYYKGMYLFNIDKAVPRRTSNLHVDHSTYIGGSSAGNLSVGVAVTPNEKILIAGTFGDLQGSFDASYSLKSFTIPQNDGSNGKIIKLNAAGDKILSAVTLGNEVHYFDKMRFGDERIVVSGSWGVTCLNAEGDSVIWTKPASLFSHAGKTTGYLKVDIDNITGKVVVMRNATAFRTNATSYMNKEVALSTGTMWVLDETGAVISPLNGISPVGLSKFQDVAIYKDTVVAGGVGDYSLTSKLMYYDISSKTTWNKYVDSTFSKTYLRNIHKIDFESDNRLYLLGEDGDNSDNERYSYYMILNHQTGQVLTRYYITDVETDRGAMHLSKIGFLHIGGSLFRPDKREDSKISGELQGAYTKFESAYLVRDLRYGGSTNFVGGFNRNSDSASIYYIDSRTFGSGVTEREVVAGIGISQSATGQWITGKYAEYDTTYHLWKFSKDSAMLKAPVNASLNSVLFTHSNPLWKNSTIDSLDQKVTPGDTVICPGYENADVDFEIIGMSNNNINLCLNQKIQVKNITPLEFKADSVSYKWSFGTGTMTDVIDNYGTPVQISWDAPGEKVIILKGNVKSKIYNQTTKVCEDVTALDSVSSLYKRIFINVVDPGETELYGSIDGVFNGVCPGSIIPFSVQAVDGISEYEWTLPNSDWEIVSSDKKSNSVEVFIGKGSGYIRVNGKTSCSETLPLSAYVNVTGEDNDILYVAGDGKYIVDDLDSAYVSGGNKVRGVYRFNGTNWTMYDYIRHNVGLSSTIKIIRKDPSGNIWIGTSDNGLTKFDGTVFTNYRSIGPLTIDDIDFDVAGNVWLIGQKATNEGRGLYKFDGTTFTYFTVVDAFGYGSPGNGIANSLVHDASRNLIWISLKNRGLMKFKLSNNAFDTTFFVRSETHGLRNNYIENLEIDNDGNVWSVHSNDISTNDGTPTTTTGGVSKYNVESNTFNTYLEDNQCISIKKDNSGKIWVGRSDNDNLFRLAVNGTTEATYTATDYAPTLSSKSVKDINVNNDGHILIAIGGGKANGVAVFNGVSWTHHKSNNNGLGNGIDTNSHVMLTVAADNSGHLWAGHLMYRDWSFSTIGGRYQAKGYSRGYEGGFTFKPKIKDEALYEVFVKWPSTDWNYPSRDFYVYNHAIKIKYKGGIANIITDTLKRETGIWHSLGQYTFPASDTCFVQLSSSSPVYADAVMFKRVSTGYSKFDSTMVQKLQNLGYKVTIVPDGDFEVDQMTCTRAVFISSTVDATRIPPEITNYEIPVISSSPDGFRTLKYLSSTNSFGVVAGQKDLTIVDLQHELGKKLNPTSTVLTNKAIMSWANPIGEASKIATNAGGWGLFSYDKNSQMSGFKAPERQVGLYLYDDPNNPNNFTAQTDTVLKYSSCWVSRTCPGYQKIKITKDTINTCPRSSFEVPFTVTGDSAFKDGNEFTIRLSNKYGDFNGLGVFKEIARMKGTTSGTITVNLSEQVMPGTEYKIRIESTNPSIISENIAIVIINPRPVNVGTIVGTTEHCTGEKEEYELAGLTGFIPLQFEWVLPENSTAVKTYSGDSISTTDPRRVYSKFELINIVLNKEFNPLSDGTLRVRIQDALCGWGTEQDYTETTLSKYSVPFLIDTSNIGIGYPRKCPGDTLEFNTADLPRIIDRADYYKWTYPKWMTMGGDTGVGVNGRLHDTVTHNLADTVWVQGVNHCGFGPKNYKILTIDTTQKLKMDSITGPKQFCAGDVGHFVYSPGYFATQYNWILPEGVSVINKSQNQVDLLFSVNIPKGRIIAEARNGCGPIFDTLNFTMDTAVKALIITGDGTLTGNDLWMSNQLKSAAVKKYINIGTVDVIDDDTPPCSCMNCYSLIIVSASANTIQPEYKGAKVPVIVNNPLLLDEFEIAAEGGFNLANNIFIFDNTHDVTKENDLGDLQVYNTIGQVGGAGSDNKSIPARFYPNAYSFATVSDVDYTNISYKQGQVMGGGTDPEINEIAKGKRMAFFLADNNATLSPQGSLLFDRAVCWATNTCDTTVRIQTAKLTETTYCLGDSLDVLFETFPSSANFDAGNKFNVELSDPYGNFFNPIIIGSETAVNATAASNSIKANFPSNFVDQCIEGGVKYRIRVSGTSPVVVGGLNGELNGDQFITLKSCRSKNYDTVRIYRDMDTTQTIQFCGFICDSIKGIPETGALKFNGTSNYVNLGTTISTPLVNSSFTLEAWVKADDYQTAANDQVLFYCKENVTNDLKYSLYINKNDGSVNFKEGPFAQDNHKSFSNILDNAVPTSPYHHVALVLEVKDASTSNLRIYIDGSERLNKNIVDVFAGEPGRVGAGDNWYIGSAAGTSSFFNGFIADARVWNTARTPVQLAMYKTQCPPLTTAGLVALYQFSNGSGTTVTDQKNGYNGNINGTGYAWVSTGVNISCGTNPHNYRFFAELSTPSADYPGRYIPDSLEINDAALCGTGNRTIVARIPKDLVNKGYYKYRVVAKDLTDGDVTPYDAYSKVIVVRHKPSSYIIPAETILKGLNCFGSTDTAAGRVRFKLNIETDSIWLPITYYWTKPNGTTDTVKNILYDGQAVRDYNKLDTGTYTLKIVDDLGFSETHVFNVGEPTKLQLTDTNFTNLKCFGVSTGAMRAYISGGTKGFGGYSFLWDSPQIINLPDMDTIFNLPAGTYNLKIEDKNKCTDDYGPFTLNEPRKFELAAPLSFAKDVTIKGVNNGELQIAVTGGTPQYSLSHDTLAVNTLSQVDTIFKYTGLYSGIYDSIHLTDKNGCEFYTSLTIYEPGQLKVDTAIVTDLKCFGDTTGVITVKVSGGIKPYAIIDTAGVWAKLDSNTFSAINLAAGNYNFEVKDFAGATDKKIYTVNGPAQITIGISKINVAVNSLKTGEIIAQIAGGIMPYSYVWDIPSEIQMVKNSNRDTIDKLGAGDYKLTLIDGNNCPKDTTITITEPLTPFTVTINPTHVKCNGASTGTAIVIHDAGYAPYTYNWSNGAPSNDSVMSIPQGTYKVTVTDYYGRTATAETTITQNPQIVITPTVTDVLIKGDNTGKVVFTISGGEQPYRYVWNGGSVVYLGSNVSDSIINLVAASYSLVVSDTNNCTQSEPITISEPDEPLAVSIITTDMKCFGINDGAMTAVGTNGKTPYGFKWNTGDSAETLTGLSHGIIYAVTITDALGTTAVASDTILTAPELIINENVNMPTCISPYGDIEITSIDGGTKPINSYLWSNGKTTSYVTNLIAGDYTLTVTDSVGCEFVKTYTIDSRGVQMSLVSDVKIPYCDQSADGEIDIIVTGGVPLDNGKYNYKWSYTGVADGEPLFEEGKATKVDNGRYFVTVTDKYNCQEKTSITVEYTNDQCFKIGTGFTPNGDGYNDYFEIMNIELFPKASVFVFDRWRNIVFSKKGGYNNDWDGTFKGKPLPMDTYHFIIKLADDKEPETGQITIIR